MSSKRLASILSTVPPATVSGENLNIKLKNSNCSVELEYTRIVAIIPQVLKDEIREYIRNNKGNTDTTVILKALKNMGFNVPQEWIIDKRSTR